MKTTILSRISNLEERETDIDFLQRVKEIEEWYEGKKKIYNSPEQVELRRKEYEKTIEEGNARRERMHRHD